MVKKKLLCVTIILLLCLFTSCNFLNQIPQGEFIKKITSPFKPSESINMYRSENSLGKDGIRIEVVDESKNIRRTFYWNIPELENADVPIVEWIDENLVAINGMTLNIEKDFYDYTKDGIKEIRAEIKREPKYIVKCKGKFDAKLQKTGFSFRGEKGYKNYYLFQRIVDAKGNRELCLYDILNDECYRLNTESNMGIEDATFGNNAVIGKLYKIRKNSNYNGKYNFMYLDRDVYNENVFQFNLENHSTQKIDTVMGYDLDEFAVFNGKYIKYKDYGIDTDYEIEEYILGTDDNNIIYYNDNGKILECNLNNKQKYKSELNAYNGSYGELVSIKQGKKKNKFLFYDNGIVSKLDNGSNIRIAKLSDEIYFEPRYIKEKDGNLYVTDNFEYTGERVIKVNEKNGKQSVAIDLRQQLKEEKLPQISEIEESNITYCDDYIVIEVKYAVKKDKNEIGNFNDYLLIFDYDGKIIRKKVINEY